MKQVLENIFAEIISVDNLLEAWKEFLKGKRNKKDVQEFSFQLMEDILALHYELLQKSYKHGEYISFKVHDPKPREIHKAPVRDRLLHHAIYRKLYPFFNRKFIADSFSCRNKKGTHKALDRLRNFAYKVSKNNTRTCWVLQCDIKKFFASIDHQVLLQILQKSIHDQELIWFLKEIIESFCLIRVGVGLPLGNLTSQLLVNIYMNEFDQFIKQKLKIKWYLRYADDFVLLSKNRKYLENLIPQIDSLLQNQLKLSLHPNKVTVKTLVSGIDFLGWISFTDHRILRTKTKRRMIERLKTNKSKETVNSYLGLIGHGNTNKLKKEVFFLKN